MLGITVAAAEQIDQGFFRERLYGVLLRIRHDRFKQPAIIDNGVSNDTQCVPLAQRDACQVSKTVAVKAPGDP